MDPGKDSSSSNDDIEKLKMVRKLALWNSQTFTPITSHQELAPILANLGFVRGQILPLPPLLHGTVPWQTYNYTASSQWRKLQKPEDKPPTVKLPYSEIDGLHEYTYRAFLDALKFYLDQDDNYISTIFHVRSTEVNMDEIQGTIWKYEPEKKRYIYRGKTIDRRVPISMMVEREDDDDDPVIRWKTDRSGGSSFTTLVPLKDIITHKK